MSNVSRRFFALVALVIFGQLAYANEPAHADTAKKEEKFNPSKMIMHHVADAHEFHFWGEGANSFSVPLPVILYTKNGIVSFLSSEFHHDDEARHIVEKKGQKFVKFHEKIYYASEATNEHGEYVALHDGHPENARPLDFSVTKNVFTILFTVLLLILIFIPVAKAYRRNNNGVPSGLQSFLEPVILFVRDDIAIPNLGKHYLRFMPYLLSVFFFIWFSNMLGLIPFFPGGANVTGNIAITMVLAVFTFVLTTINGNKNYWGHVFTPHVPWWLYPLMVPVEIMGLFTKPFALMIRLFANITAGHILVLSLVSLIFIFKSIMVSFAAIPFTIFISLIELMVAFIQAFIFTILSALFIGLAIAEPEHAEHH
jgi:F-type H+-transporting ATPase subunit a